MVVEGVVDEAIVESLEHVLARVLLVARRGGVLEVELHHGRAQLLVLTHEINHVVVVGHGVVLALGGILLRLGDVGEGLLDLLLHLVDIYIAHYDNSLQVGAIPLHVVVAQSLMGEVHHDVHRADRHSVAVFRAGMQHGHDFLVHALGGRVACAPLLLNDAALAVYLIALEQQVVAPVVQNEQA